MRFCIKDFFSKCAQIGRKLSKSLMESDSFYTVFVLFIRSFKTNISKSSGGVLLQLAEVTLLDSQVFLIKIKFITFSFMFDCLDSF